MRVTDWWVLYIRITYHVCGTPLGISGNASGVQDLFMRLGLAVLRKHLMDDYRQMVSRDAPGYLGALLE